MKNVGIFIDYDNLYVTIEKYYELKGRTNYQTEIIRLIKEHFKDDKILMVKAFADFQKINPVLTDLQINQVELRHVYSSNSDSKNRKNASDIAMTIDVIKSIYSKSLIDKFVLVSSDSDMLPLINEIQYFGKEVFVIYSEHNSSSMYNSILPKESYHTIELLMGVDKYSPITWDDIKSNLNEIINIIHEDMVTIKRKHRNMGTSSKKDVVKSLYEHGCFVENDLSLAYELMEKNGVFKYEKVKGNIHETVFLNPEFISEHKITLTSTLIEPSHYHIEEKVLTR